MEKMKKPAYRWVILVIVCLVGILSNYMQYQISALAVFLMPMLKISQTGFSTLMMMPMLTAVFLSIPMGTYGDRIGPKKVVLAGLAVAVIGAWVRTFGLNFPMQVLSMFLLGAGIAALNSNLVKIFSVWFGDQTQMAMGFFFGSAGVGVILAQMVAPMFSVFNSYLIAAIILTVATIMWIILIKDAPDGVTLPPATDSPLKYFGVAAKSRNVWLVALCYGFSMAASTAFAGFIPQTLINSNGFTPQTAGMVASAAALGSIIGSIVGPAISSRLGKWKGFLVLTIVVGACFMTYFWAVVIMMQQAPTLAILLTIMFVSGAFGAINGPIVQAMPFALPDIRGKYAGSAGGLVSTIGLLCAFFIPVIISAVAGGNYVLNLGLESLIFLLSVVFVLLIPELGPKGEIAQSIAKQDQLAAAQAQA
ncbi:MFS transporter [Bifidobacterium xylocopae]|nr:MFS transporter [Bifidobacterium xylocopae]